MPSRFQSKKERYEFFMASWARARGISLSAAKRSPSARGYYAMASGAGRYRAAQAWVAAGVIEENPDYDPNSEDLRSRYRYVDQ